MKLGTPLTTKDRIWLSNRGPAPITCDVIVSGSTVHVAVPERSICSFKTGGNPHACQNVKQLAYWTPKLNVRVVSTVLDIVFEIGDVDDIVQAPATVEDNVFCFSWLLPDESLIFVAAKAEEGGASGAMFHGDEMTRLTGEVDDALNELVLYAEGVTIHMMMPAEAPEASAPHAISGRYFDANGSAGGEFTVFDDGGLKVRVNDMEDVEFRGVWDKTTNKIFWIGDLDSILAGDFSRVCGFEGTVDCDGSFQDVSFKGARLETVQESKIVRSDIITWFKEIA